MSTSGSGGMGTPPVLSFHRPGARMSGSAGALASNNRYASHSCSERRTKPLAAAPSPGNLSPIIAAWEEERGGTSAASAHGERARRRGESSAVVGEVRPRRRCFI